MIEFQGFRLDCVLGLTVLVWDSMKLNLGGQSLYESTTLVKGVPSS